MKAMDMHARDIMTSEVVWLRPDMTVQEAAAVLVAHRISGAPVIEEPGILLGMVSESDLLHRVELGTQRRHAAAAPCAPWQNRDAEDYVKSHGRLVMDVMTEEVVSVDEMAPLAEVADLFDRHRLRRVPVLKGGRVVGIVSRADLLQALADAPTPEPAPAGVADGELLARLLAALQGRQWAFSEHDFTVRDGIVHLWNRHPRPHSELHAMIVAAETLPGVKEVEVHDETMPRPAWR